jgi:hypothetical protein
MDRRKFLERVVAAASVTAASPLMGGAVRGMGLEEGSHGESLPGHANPRRPAATQITQAMLPKGFVHPPESAAPWVYWVWLNFDTTPAAMTYDLEQMKAKGIAGFILYDCGAGNLAPTVPRMILVDKDHKFEYEFVKEGEYTGCYNTPIPFPPLQAWTPLWRERIRFVAKEAARLNLKFCLAMGLAGTSGQISDEYGNQELAWSETAVDGSAAFNGTLPLPAAHALRRGNHWSEDARAAGQQHFHDVAVLAIPDRAGFSANEVVDLTSKMDVNGHIIWNPPAGKWKILRFAQSPTDARDSFGFFSDAMSSEATDQVWAVTMGPLLAEMLPEERKGLIGIEDDSWEGGEFTWTRKFPEEFKRRRGYDLIPYLPALAGAELSDAATRDRIRRDHQLTTSDLMADCHYGHLEKLCKENGLIFFSEAAGPNLHTADLLKNLSRVDMPMAEFWVPNYHRPTPKSRFWARNGACASHIYGMPVNMDEAFTSIGPEWEESLFDLKPVADRAFCEGVNRICFHNFSHSPSLTATPGYVYYAGTHYNARTTWWDQAPAFNTYLARCCYLLQQGKFVADAVFYAGDNLGDGDPMQVIHPTLGEGYDYDCSNTDVLLNRMSVKNGRIVLPDGMSYRVLVLPDNQPMTLGALLKVADLIKAGATVVGPRPAGLAGLPIHPDEEKRFDALVEQLWGSDRGSAAAIKRPIGAGWLVPGQTARQTLLDSGELPDFEHNGLSEDGAIYWIHRKMEAADIYFVSSHWQPAEKLECTFRVSGKQPEIWDPVTGTMRDAMAFRQEGGRTIVPLEFDPCGSMFVIFRKHIDAHSAGKAETNYPLADDVLHTFSGPWEVSFDPKWGGPEKVIFDQLIDWTMRPEFGIKHYSGTAIYRKRFDLTAAPAKSARVLLDLGELHEVAAVRLNGVDLGVAWTRPARLDLTGVLKATGNDLEITVVNLWPNRLIGDEGLPKESRLTETNIHKFNSSTPLLPSGLIGPVRILSVKKQPEFEHVS